MWRYLLLALIGLPAVALTYGIVTSAATARAVRRLPPVPDDELGVAFLAPWAALGAFLLGFLILCLVGRGDAGAIIAASAGPFLILALAAIGWSRPSASVWMAQTFASGLAFMAVALLLLA
ncbi:hypothetical protein sos41_23130 [Alphaproteobacteria bacterium SO-S41]|nr:hypothetical protein sos41_23130 [Alphaproteobacteria bacterium SO-S41]